MREVNISLKKAKQMIAQNMEEKFFFEHPLQNGEVLSEETPLQSWSSDAERIFCINAYPNGISVSRHDGPLKTNLKRRPHPSTDISSLDFSLRLRDTKNHNVPDGKCYIFKENFAREFEAFLFNLQKQRKLNSSVIYFGTVLDPFYNFNKKLHITLACIQILERYKPKRLIIQTRSPMVIAALPYIKLMEERAFVSIFLESPHESIVSRYTPEQPKISDRLTAIRGLREQGVRVNLAVSPILPYGDYEKDVWEFARFLVENGDFLTFASLAKGVSGEDVKLRAMRIARILAADGNFKLLRPNAHKYLARAVQVLAPEKLILPTTIEKEPYQLSLFAA